MLIPDGGACMRQGMTATVFCHHDKKKQTDWEWLCLMWVTTQTLLLVCNKEKDFLWKGILSQFHQGFHEMRWTTTTAWATLVLLHSQLVRSVNSFDCMPPWQWTNLFSACCLCQAGWPQFISECSHAVLHRWFNVVFILTTAFVSFSLCHSALSSSGKNWLRNGPTPEPTNWNSSHQVLLRWSKAVFIFTAAIASFCFDLLITEALQAKTVRGPTCQSHQIGTAHIKWPCHGQMESPVTTSNAMLSFLSVHLC